MTRNAGLAYATRPERGSQATSCRTLGELREAVESVVSGGGLGVRLLLMLYEAPGVPGDVARALGLTCGAVEGDFSRLREIGLVVRIEDSDGSWCQLAGDRVRMVLTETIEHGADRVTHRRTRSGRIQS